MDNEQVTQGVLTNNNSPNNNVFTDLWDFLTGKDLEKKKEKRKEVEKEQTKQKEVWENLKPEDLQKLFDAYNRSDADNITEKEWNSWSNMQKTDFIKRCPYEWKNGYPYNIYGEQLYMNADRHWVNYKPKTMLWQSQGENGEMATVGMYGEEQRREEERYREQMEFQREQWEYQKAQWEEAKAREDTAYQRAFNDISASGFNPLAETANEGTSEFGGGGFSGASNYTEHGFADSLNRLSLEQSGRKDIAELALQRDSLMLEQQKLAAQNADSQAQLALSFKQIAADLLKNGIIDEKTAKQYAETFLSNMRKTGNNLTSEGENIKESTEGLKKDNRQKDYDYNYQKDRGTNFNADSKIQIAETAVSTTAKTAKKANDAIQAEAIAEQITKELNGVTNPTIKLNYLIDNKERFITYYGKEAYDILYNMYEKDRTHSERTWKNKDEYND